MTVLLCYLCVSCAASLFIGAFIAVGMGTVSLYSTKPEIDCGEIARTFGGGGHKGAAGFQCTELPFAI
jgi:nanoRNase/pAp phosphatase (c-di-AMP/oligoRNAs hydrolase)